MVLGSLFDGISGFPLAASWAGIETKWISEIDAYCLKVSKKNFPNAIQYGDIREIGKGRKWEPDAVGIICGGFPCQPFSVAGQQKGKDDNRYLWPEMLRIISEVRPRWVIGENVLGIISLALEEVLTSLENEGYKTQVFIIPACAVNAPHRRDRVWIVAHTDSPGCKERYPAGIAAIPGFCTGNAVKTISSDTMRKQNERINKGRLQRESAGGNWEKEWLDVATELCRVDDGISDSVDRDKSKRLKALGNAIVPQIAYEIFKAIVAVDNESSGNT